DRGPCRLSPHSGCRGAYPSFGRWPWPPGPPPGLVETARPILQRWPAMSHGKSVARTLPNAEVPPPTFGCDAEGVGGGGVKFGEFLGSLGSHLERDTSWRPERSPDTPRGWTQRSPNAVAAHLRQCG